MNRREILKTYPLGQLPPGPEADEFNKSVFCIACPVGDDIKFDWLAGFIGLAKGQFTLIGDNAVPVDLARNKMVDYYLVNHPECDYLLFWDLDTIPPPDGLYRLWKWNQPIVSGLYHQKIEPYYPLLMKKHAQSGTGFFAVIGWQDGELYEVDATGMGFCLIKREVFQIIDPPWFAFTDISEDFEFCQKAKRNGIRTFVDTNVKCRHIGDKLVGTDDYLKYRQALMDQGYIRERIQAARLPGTK